MIPNDIESPIKRKMEPSDFEETPRPKKLRRVVEIPEVVTSDSPTPTTTASHSIVSASSNAIAGPSFVAAATAAKTTITATLDNVNPFAYRPPSRASRRGGSKRGTSQSRSSSSRSSVSSPLSATNDYDNSPSASNASSAPSNPFSTATKLNVKRMYDTRCWVCSTPGTDSLDASHVISQANAEFESLRQRGILPIISLSDGQNAIPLCKSCHNFFDQDPPPFIIIPFDLDFFLEFERRDFKRRLLAYREALKLASDKSQVTPLIRYVPTYKHYEEHLRGTNRQSGGNDGFGGLYQIYIRRHCLWDLRTETHMPVGTYKSPKQWHGAPTAMILHAARTLCTPTSHGWIPKDTLIKLFELIMLWRMEPTYFNGKLEDDDDQNDVAVPSHEPEQSNQTSDGGSNMTSGDSHSGHEKSTAHTTEPSVQYETGQDYLSTQKKSQWIWGPLSCSNDVIKFMSPLPNDNAS